MAEQVAKKLPQKALTQGVVYPIVKKVAAYIGVEMTKQTFAKSVSKAIPVVGAAIRARSRSRPTAPWPSG